MSKCLHTANEFIKLQKKYIAYHSYMKRKYNNHIMKMEMKICVMKKDEKNNTHKKIDNTIQRGINTYKIFK